jgi:hypothetical protein
MKNKEEKVVFINADCGTEMQNQLDEKVNPLIRNDGWTIKDISSSASASQYGRHIYAFFILERKRTKKLNE